MKRNSNMLFFPTNPISKLIEASKKGKLEHIKLLLANGTSINVTNNHGLSPLMAAASRNRVTTMQYLLENGANLNAITNNGSTVLMEAIVPRFDTTESCALLVSKGIGLTFRDSAGQTALHKACALGKTSIVKLLIQHGADVNAKDNAGGTPIRNAFHQKSIKLLDILVNAKANIFELHSHIASGWSNTLIGRAIVWQDMDMLKALIRMYNINLTYSDGSTPLVMAYAEHMLHVLLLHDKDTQSKLVKDIAILNFLIDSGADVNVVYIIRDSMLDRLRTQILAKSSIKQSDKNRHLTLIGRALADEQDEIVSIFEKAGAKITTKDAQNYMCT